MMAPRPDALRIVRVGVKYGVAIPGKIAWLPPEMWAGAAELTRRIESMQAELERMEQEVARVNAVIDAAQAEADAAGGVQTPWSPHA